ncbi:primase-helicase family protein, partial [Pseudomonas aeruginosa]
SSFTAWAQGQCVLAFEEVHMVGHNRYDVLNRFKPLVTNRVIEIHAKGRDPYNVENTTSYLLFSNYRKALPLQDNERRYCVLFSQWQQREKLAEFMEENPDYYNDLYAALDESAPALRQWMLQLEQSPDFHPDGNAPITPAFRYMVRVSQPKELRGIREIIESKEFPDISDDLLNITRLESLTMNDDYDFELPAPKTLNYILENHGFIPIGRVRIGQERYRFYSRNPEKFTWRNAEGDLIQDTEKIRKYMEGEQDDDEDDDL